MEGHRDQQHCYQVLLLLKAKQIFLGELEADIDVLSEQSDTMGHGREPANDAELHAALD